MSAPAKKLGAKGVAGKRGPAGKKAPAGGKKGKGAAAQVRLMMYGFGDDAIPYKETVDLVEDIVVDYASALAHKALAGAAGKGGRMLPEDLLYLLRKDPHKFARAQELLRMNEEIKEARKLVEEEDKLLSDL